jgi:hypothetical protein
MTRAINTLGWRLSANRMLTDCVVKCDVPRRAQRAATFREVASAGYSDDVYTVGFKNPRNACRIERSRR